MAKSSSIPSMRYLLLGLFLVAAAHVRAANAPLPMVLPKPGTAIDFERDVYPILKANCIACHNKTTTKADLNMETPELMKKGGESGASLIPGQSEKSPLFQAANHTWESAMPPKGNKVGAVNLKPEEIGLLKMWIDQGAKGGLTKHRQITWQPLPPGLNPIYATAMTQDGRWAACSRANQIWVYDLATRKFITRLTDEALAKSAPGIAHQDLVQSLAFSPDGLTLASGSFQEIKLWRRKPATLVTQKAAAALPAPANDADLKRIATDLKIPAAQPSSLSTDGKRLATATADGTVHLWDPATKKEVLAIKGDLATESARNTLLWQTARQQLEVAYQTVFIAQTETDAKALEDRLKKAQEAIVAAKKAQEEKKKAVAPAQAAKVAAEKESKDVADLIAKLPAGTKPDAALEKRQKEAQTKLEKAAKDQEDALAAVKTSENHATDAEAEVKIIEAAKVKSAQTLADAKAALAAATKAVATAKAEAAKPAVFTAAKDAIASLAFSTEGTRIAALTVTGTLKVWAVESGAPVELIPAPEAATPAPAPAGLPISVAAAAGEGFAWIRPDGMSCRQSGSSDWSLEKTLGGNVPNTPLVDRVNALRFSPDGKMLAAGSGEPSRTGDVTLWAVPSGKLTQTWQEKHHDSILSLDFSPDGKLLATGGADKAVRISEVPGGKQVRLFEGHTHHVLGVSFRQDGRVLASAGADNAVKIWDMITGDRKKNVDGWDKEVTSIQFLGATDTLLTSAGDNRVRVVRDSGAEVRSLAGLPDFMYTASGSRLGSFFIAGGQDSVLRLWEAEKGTQVAQFEAK